MSAPRDFDLGCQSNATFGRTSPAPDYRLGPGDVLEVQIAGRLEVTKQTVIVGPEGVVNIPPIGSIDVRGLTLLEAHRRLSEQARSLFRFVDATVAVVGPRCFEIIVSGEVERPGTVISSATRRVHDVMLALGGITPRGSVRRVRLIRGGTVTELDLLKFEVRGDLSQNPYVEEGMQIVVPPRTAAVTLSGAVRKPGEYEIGVGQSLRELMDLVGGVSHTGAPSDTRLTRIGPEGRKETFSIDLRKALTPPTDVPIQPGDVIFVPPLTSIQDVVELRGAFLGTGESGKTTTAGKATIVQRFELARGERVKDLVVRAGGPAAFADLRLAFIERAGSAGPRQKIPVDLHALLVEKDQTPNLELENGDVLTLPVAEDRVYVVGEVKNPGAQDFRPDLTPREYVTLAGGPNVRAKVKNTVVTFRSGHTYPMAEAPPLEPGAVVTVPEVSVKWWQDYVQIANVVASLITGYTGLFLLFGGRLRNDDN